MNSTAPHRKITVSIDGHELISHTSAHAVQADRGSCDAVCMGANRCRREDRPVAVGYSAAGVSCAVGDRQLHRMPMLLVGDFVHGSSLEAFS